MEAPAKAISDPDAEGTGEVSVRRGGEQVDAVSGVGRRVDELLEGAKALADEIRAEAEAEGERYLEERRAEADKEAEERRRELVDLSTALATRVERVEREVADLVGVLRAAVDGLGGLREVKGEGGDPADDASANESQALLRATQMAAAGSDREEIERVLKDDYEIADPAALIDGLLSGERA